MITCPAVTCRTPGAVLGSGWESACPCLLAVDDACVRLGPGLGGPKHGVARGVPRCVRDRRMSACLPWSMGAVTVVRSCDGCAALCCMAGAWESSGEALIMLRTLAAHAPANATTSFSRAPERLVRAYTQISSLPYCTAFASHAHHTCVAFFFAPMLTLPPRARCAPATTVEPPSTWLAWTSRACRMQHAASPPTA